MSLNDDTIAAQLNAMKELGILDAPQPISDKPMRVPITWASLNMVLDGTDKMTYHPRIQEKD
jgi:hypothetical protein